ncbi:protein kinase domain-containing protein [Enhygromyxa salina]|uniref:Serine/threonine-protein kinase PknL n=1 Tax=Enhygromyxa salina TaxID=215803 RepID=A0A2S9XXD6_9BACT|nr:protein kinase [Enhygromyxa salina]PRP97381.1 Serine/threonine-protein kinase PknL [Enhygromyxa salina]
MHTEISDSNASNPMRGDVAPDGVLEVGELVAYRYRVERSGRSHPLGELVRCHDETADRPVLLQRLRREFASPRVRDRLFETRGSASLEVAAIADILDYGEDLDGRPFLVTAWHDDASLAEVERPLGFHEAVAIALRVATALEPVHRRGLAHGGIEPHSILVDADRELTGLLDFGLVPALEAGTDKLRAMPLMIAPAYAAPELIRGESVSPAADVYALGILLWELILGSVPFRGATLRVLDSHLNSALPDFELPFDAPASFEWILRRMLAKQPSERFADAGEVAAELRVYAALEHAVALVDDRAGDAVHEDEATTAFERALDKEDSWLVLAAAARAPLECAEIPEFEPPPARRSPWRWAALAGLSCAVLLSWWGFTAHTHEVVADASHNSAVDPAGDSAVDASEAELAVGVAQPLAPPPKRGVEAPDLGADTQLRTKLSAAHLRARKSELYRRVEQRCIDGRMRRTVKLTVHVAPTGAVETARVVGGMGSTKLGRCARRQAHQLEFPATEEGGAYTYTLRLR